MSIKIDLDANICSTFRQVVVDILECNVPKVVLKGGRNTTKSAVAVIAGLIFVIKYQCSALFVVEHSNKATERLSKNILKYMKILNIRHMFLYRKKPDKFILLDAKGKPTDHEIDITGASDPDDIKSMTTEDGGYSYVFLEEAGNFKSKKDIDNIFSTAMRGATGQHVFVMAYNPPFETGHHLNVEYSNANCGKALGFNSNYDYRIEKIHNEELDTDFEYKCLIHHSTYLDVMKEHPDWIGGEVTIAEYELQRKENHRAWEWDKLGMVTGSDANVFWNIKDWEYDENVSSVVKSILFKFGLDCSNGAADPWALIKVLWVPNKKEVYILDERVVEGKTNGDLVVNKYKQVADAWITINPLNSTGYGDSAVPYNVEGVQNQQVEVKGRLQNVNVYPAKKGFHYSKQRSVIFLQNLNGIYVDKNKCPIFYNEIKNYTYKIDKAGNITTDLVDGNDHLIDALIYSLVDIIPNN